MKIAYSLHPIIHHFNRGIHFYIKNLLENLLRLKDEMEFHIFFLQEEIKEINFPKKVYLHKLKYHWKKLPYGFQWLWEFTLLPWEIRGIKAEIVHSLDLSTYPFLPCKRVTTVHDLTPFLFPTFLSSKKELWKYRIRLFSLKLADAVIAISKNTASDLTKHLGIPPFKIKVIPYGISSIFRPLAEDLAKAYIRERFQLKGKFILFVGAISPNKNVGRLIEAFSLLRHSDIRVQLIICASLKEPFYTYFSKKSKNLDVSSSIKWLGSLTQEELLYLYNCCEVFVYPSLYEGFGLPPLEAMACGTPIIATKVGGIPEMVEDGKEGLLVPPEDSHTLKDVILYLLKNEDLREKMAKNLER